MQRHLAAAVGGLVLILIAPFLPASAADIRPPLHLTIVHFSDLDRMEAKDGRGGLAKVAAVVEAARAKADAVLVTHGGDAISPSLMSTFDEGEHMIALLNALELDLFVLGNHEFDFGPEATRQRVAEADFPVLGANVRQPDGDVLAGTEERVLLSFGDWRIGAFGLVTPQTATSSQPGALAFHPELETAAAQADALRSAGADFVIALAHSTAETDLALVRQGAANLVLGGHDHVLHLLKPESGTVLAEPGAQGDHVALIHLAIEAGAAGEPSWSIELEIVDTLSVEPDPAMAEAVEGYLGQIETELAVELAVTETALDTRRTAVRSGENAFGSLVAEAMRQAAGADAAIQNGGGIRGQRFYPAGSTLTRGDIIAELPFHNRVELLEVPGETLWQALEFGVGAVERGAGRFPHVAGLRFRYDPAKPAGERLLAVTVGGTPLDPARRYRLAVNAFTAGGGDGYTMLADAPRLAHPAEGKTDAALVIQYLQRAGRVAPKVEGRALAVR